eukprot:TRINITY_DN24967_c0_g1_i1.p1 TRINITY_DN24967_c0_g1~~TRINITY_DN24967_c0_g1_i1.p1  ORF type:complete len:1534 (-),score=299.63 TRINITY_DN24967_c0_g1_i1:38-4639(-)
MKRPAVAEAPSSKRLCGPGLEAACGTSEMPSPSHVLAANVETDSGDLRGFDQAFDRLVEKYPNRPAVEDELGQNWTYRELQEASLRMAAGMLSALDGDGGTGPPTVAVLMRRSSSWVAACLGVSRLGVLLALSSDLGVKEEVTRSEDAICEHRPRLLVLERALENSAAAEPLLAASRSGTRLVYAEDLLTTKVGCEGIQRPDEWGTRHIDDALYFVYTGGTTSASKCVVETHRMALHELETYPDFGVLSSEDRILHQTSAYWGATSLGILNLPFACGGCLVLITSNGTPAEVTRVVEKYGLTVAGLVPSVLSALEEERCHSLRTVFTWGEPMRPETISNWGRRVTLLDLLISSEYWLVLCADHRQSSKDRLAGFRPVRNARLTLLDPGLDEDVTRLAVGTKEVARGEVGELYMAGPMVSAKGYTKSALNEGAFVDLAVGPGSPLRHYRTRDLARWKPDGSLEYCGRCDGYAKVGGKWVDLTAVENNLLAAGCKEAIMLWDEGAKVRHAAVVLSEAAGSSQTLTLCEAKLQALLPPQTRLHLLKSLPKSPATGKVLRSVLLQQLAQTLPSEATRTLQRAAPVRRCLALGVRLAAGVAGARDGALVPLSLALAPGLQDLLWQGSGGSSSSSTCSDGGKGSDGGIHHKTNEATTTVTAPFTDTLSAGAAGNTVNGKQNGHAGIALAANSHRLVPEGVAERVSAWLFWYRSLVCCLTAAQLKALPYICLLLLDASSTGLENLEQVLRGPMGAAGAALWICHTAKPWMRTLLSAAGALHAGRAYGGKGWTWTFWLGFSSIGDSWSAACWHAWPRHQVCTQRAWRAVCGLQRALGLEVEADEEACAAKAKKPLSYLPLCSCSYCWAWKPEGGGSTWHRNWYCSECSEGWKSYKRQRVAEGAVVSPDSSPPDTPRDAVSEASGGGGGSATNGISPSPSASSLATAKDVPTSKAPFKPLVESLDFAEYEVKLARSRQPSGDSKKTAADSSARPNINLSAVAQVVERSTGVCTNDPDGGQISSLESLKVIILVSALRRELKVNLAASDVLKCSTVADLEVLVEASKSQALTSNGAGQMNGKSHKEPKESGRYAIYAIPRFWKAPVGWLIKLDEVPDEAAMRIACRALVRRHTALRATPYAAGDEAVASVCLCAVQTLLVLRALFGVSDMESTVMLNKQAGLGLMSAWPRVKTSPPSGGPPMCKAGGPEEVAHFEWLRFETEAELRHAAWLRARSRGFKTPASISVLLHGDLSYMHVAVNHAVTDAACIVPLVADLLELHRVAKGISGSDDLEALAEAALEASHLPPAPDGLAISEARLCQTLLREVVTDAGDERLDLAHNSCPPRRRGYDHYAKLLPRAGHILEAGAAVVGIPTDHLLVGALAAAFSAATGLSEVKLSLIVPMRDGPGHGQAVANLASTRHMSVSAKGRSLFAIALDLSKCFRRREWQLCKLLDDDGDRLFINLRGIPAFDGASPVIEPQDTSRSPTRFVRNMVEMFADQETQHSWTMWMGVREDVDGSLFTKALRKALWGLATDPLSTLEM